MNSESFQTSADKKSKRGVTQDIKLSSYIPGGISTLCAMQSEYYARAWGFNHLYESVVAASVGEFFTRFDSDKDFIQLVLLKGKVVGGIAIDHRDGVVAQLRWFILSDELRGYGLGNQLITNAMQFVDKNGFEQVYLTTFEGLDSARKLYEQFGFQLTSEQQAST